jgi:hypothetical protein
MINNKFSLPNQSDHSIIKKVTHQATFKFSPGSFSILSLGLAILISFNLFSVGFAQVKTPLMKTAHARVRRVPETQNPAGISLQQNESSLEVRVSASSDDAEERADGSITLTSSDLELVLESNVQTVGMRFNGITIPQGANITSAFIQFQTDETTSDDTTLTIHGQAGGNALTFTTFANDITNRTLTGASVEWTPQPWLTVKEAGPDQQTPNIAPVIQEIVNQQDWSAGNSLAIIISGTGKRVAEAYDGDQTGAPLLHVNYIANQPPETLDDTYSTNEDQTLIVAAPGILGNDNDNDGHPLAAIVTSQPSNGTLSLNSDGSFTYSPDPNFNGVDSFTYLANDGFTDSNIAAWIHLPTWPTMDSQIQT